MDEMNYRRSGMRQFACSMINTLPRSQAMIRGDAQYSGLHGNVSFYPIEEGTLVTAEVYGLPTNTKTQIFAMHIHEGGSCTGNQTDPFAATGGHYNPTNMPHPLHAGDLLPLFGNDGFAYYSFYTDRFKPDEVVGHTVVIHIDPDDFRTQPSGASGSKIACGVIQRA